MAHSELLKALKEQLAFFKAGGYGHSHRSSWRPTLMIRDSPTCLNAVFTTAKPCRDCVLFAMIPGRKEKIIPALPSDSNE